MKVRLSFVTPREVARLPATFTYSKQENSSQKVSKGKKKTNFHKKFEILDLIKEEVHCL
jgi:hypothetical protein